MLGRAVWQCAEMIPVYQELGNVKGSWSRCALLPPDRLVETRALLERYRSRYSVYLNTRWDEILSVLDNSREKFLSRCGWRTVWHHHRACCAQHELDAGEHE